MSIIRYVILIALLFTIYPNYSHARSKSHIGVVSIINNIVSAEENNKERILSSADKIYPGQFIKTLLNSRIQILFKDQTIINIGPDTEMLIESYIDTQQNTKFLINLSRGVVRFQSGTLPSGSYEIKSPIAVVKLKGTKVDLLVSQSGGTEIVLRNGLAAVIRSPGRSQAITPTSQPNDDLILQKQNTFLRITSDGLSATKPQEFKSRRSDFYEQEIAIEPDGTIQITAANLQRLVAERDLDNVKNNAQPINTINQSNDLIRNINKSAVLTKIINEQLRQCIGPKCVTLLNKRSILDRVKKHLRDRSSELLARIKIPKPQRPNISTPIAQIPLTLDLQAIARLKQTIAKLAKEEAQTAKKKARTAKKGARSARQTRKKTGRTVKKAKKALKKTRKTVKKAKKSLKKAKGSSVEAVSKAKEALKAARIARKEAKTATTKARATAKKAKTAAKEANSAAKIAKKAATIAKRQAKRAKKRAIAARKKARAAAKKIRRAARKAAKEAREKAAEKAD